jgi:hypothetical protein
MAELWVIGRKRELTEDEQAELSACLHYNAIFAWKLSGLYNLSLAASMTNDAEWQHEICKRIEKLESQDNPNPEFRS